MIGSNAHRERAAALAIPWPEIESRAAAQLAAWNDGPGRVAEARRRALEYYGGGAAFYSRYRSAIRTGDHSRIPGFDVMAATMANGEGYGDVLTGDDPAGELWSIVVAPAPRPPSRGVLVESAIDSAAADRAAAQLATADDWISVADAARRADVTPQWARAMIRSGRWRGRRIGGVWVVASADVATFHRHPTAGRPRVFRDDSGSIPF